MTEMTLAEVRRLDLRETDTLVVKFRKNENHAGMSRSLDHLREMFPNNKVIALVDGVELEVVRDVT
jgi:hypothetical protein